MHSDGAEDGRDLYDHEAVFERYFAPRGRPWESPVTTMETPAVWRLLGDVTGLAILELGCGDGSFGADLLARGAASYVGVDASHRMIDAATRRLTGSAATLVRADLGRYEPAATSFDLIVSLRVLHYVRDLQFVLTRAASALRHGGRLLYSHEHPVITSNEAREPDGRRADWRVDDYFVSGPREVVFLGRKVLKYHRTVEQHLEAVDAAGLRFQRLSECAPFRDVFENDQAEYDRRLRIPLFLLIEAGRVD